MIKQSSVSIRVLMKVNALFCQPWKHGKVRHRVILIFFGQNGNYERLKRSD